MKIKINNEKYLHLHIISEYTQSDIIFLKFLIEDKIKINYLYFMQSKEGFFENIIIPNNTNEIEIIADIPISKNEVNLSIQRVYNSKQLDFNKKAKMEKIVIKDKDIYIGMHGNLTNPKKIILTFPGYSSPHKAVKHLVLSWSTLQARLENENLQDDVLIVSFQDNYRESGSYMLIDDNGNLLYESVVEYIKIIQNKYKINNSNILFFGASKGASIAIYYNNFFEGSQLIASVPQLELHKYYNSRMDNVGNLYPEIKEYLKEDYIDILFDLVKNKNNECLLFLSSRDENPLFKLEELTRGRLKQVEIIWSDLPHGQVTKDNNELLITKIENWVRR